MVILAYLCFRPRLNETFVPSNSTLRPLEGYMPRQPVFVRAIVTSGCLTNFFAAATGKGNCHFPSTAVSCFSGRMKPSAWLEFKNTLCQTSTKRILENKPYFVNSCSIIFLIASGLPLPRSLAIVLPTRNCRLAVFPFLKSSIAF